MPDTFSPSKTPTTTAPSCPPLALEASIDGAVQPAIWRSEPGADQTLGTLTLASRPSAQSDTTAATTTELQERPRTQWIPLSSDLIKIPPNPASDDQSKDVEADIREMVKTLTTDNDVVREAVAEFLHPDSPPVRFQLQHPSRYFRAVFVQRDCLECHASPDENLAPETAPADTPPVFEAGHLVGLIAVTLPEGQTGPTLFFNRVFIVVAGLLAGICAIITFYIITQRFILEPVRNLRDAADQLTVPSIETTDRPQNSWQSALNITSTIKTGDEFERLAQAFHQMLIRLKISQDKLRQSNKALDMQLSELEARNLALYESNKLKSEFLANVSHELRTPLNAIIGFAEVLNEQLDPEKEKKKIRYVANVLKSGKMLLTTVNDLLDLAKLEAGKMEVRWQQCSLLEITEVLVNFTRPLAEEKQLKVKLAIDKKLALIESDPGKLQQILFNLLSNAIKFTPRRGRIDIEAVPVSKERFQVTVADTGPGILPKDQEKIFEKFRQLDGSVTREHSGTGLGLAIVKELVAMLGGDISVTTQKPKGARFTIQLPTAKSHATQPEYAAY